MLIELLDIQRALQAAQFTAAESHKDIKPLGKRAVLCATVGARGVTDVRLIEGESAPRWWTLRNGNKNSFPLIGVGSERSGGLRLGADSQLVGVALNRRAANQHPAGCSSPPH